MWRVHPINDTNAAINNVPKQSQPQPSLQTKPPLHTRYIGNTGTSSASSNSRNNADREDDDDTILIAPMTESQSQAQTKSLHREREEGHFHQQQHQQQPQRNISNSNNSDSNAAHSNKNDSVIVPTNDHNGTTAIKNSNYYFDDNDNDNYDDDDDFMTRIVDGTCRGIFPSTSSSSFQKNRNNDINKNEDDDDPHTGSLCHLPACHFNDEDLSLFMHCRQPLYFFSFFHEIRVDDSNMNNNNDDSNDDGERIVQQQPQQIIIPMGAYMVPKACEYCNGDDTNKCDPRTCHRPQLYLQKKRPPFGKASNTALWDPLSDHAIVVPSKPLSVAQEIVTAPLSSPSPTQLPPPPPPPPMVPETPNSIASSTPPSSPPQPQQPRSSSPQEGSNTSTGSSWRLGLLPLRTTITKPMKETMVLS